MKLRKIFFVPGAVVVFTAPGKTFRIKLFHYFIADFNSDGKPDNITFMIKRIKVHNMNALKDPTYRFPGNYGVEKFLELFSGNCTCSYLSTKHIYSAHRAWIMRQQAGL